MKRLAVVLAVCVCSLASAEPAKVRLSGRVLAASGKHAVYVALWRSDHFLERPVRQVRIAPGSATWFQFEVDPGRWALSAFEDRNDDGTLDMGMFGPKEPTGFWRPFSAWHKPKFEEVAVLVARDTADANITLK